MQKLLYFRLFCKEITKPCVKFSRVWTKNTICWVNFEKILKLFDENSIEKLNFYLLLGKFVAKNRNFGNNIIFLQHFFRFGGGGSNPQPPPLRTPLLCKPNKLPRGLFSRINPIRKLHFRFALGRVKIFQQR